MIADCPLALQKRESAQKLIHMQYRAPPSLPAAMCEVFQRVQLDMSVTTAEKLQATRRPGRIYITHLEKTHVTIDGGLVDVIAFDDTRESAFQNVAQLVYCYAELPAARCIPSAAKLKKWLTIPDERPSAAFRDAAGAVLDHLWELARSSEHDTPFRCFRATGAPDLSSTACPTMCHGYTVVEQSHAVFVPAAHHPQGACRRLCFNTRVPAGCWCLIDFIENGEINTEPPMAPEPSLDAMPSTNRRK
ncbi:hypothetical protein EDB83DRAFT_579078 [Lactarius deliciosus]|nr:hypothetical protein EDB83DRAFT_579078 [Lactarius deliciosus]